MNDFNFIRFNKKPQHQAPQLPKSQKYSLREAKQGYLNTIQNYAVNNKVAIILLIIVGISSALIGGYVGYKTAEVGGMKSLIDRGISLIGR